MGVHFTTKRVDPRGPDQLFSPALSERATSTEKKRSHIATPGTGRHRHLCGKVRKLSWGGREKKNAVDAITNNDIKRLARRGGVKRIGLLVPQEAKTALRDFLKTAIERASIYAGHARRKTVTTLDVVLSLKWQGMTLYGYEASTLFPNFRTSRRVRALKLTQPLPPASAHPPTSAEEHVDAERFSDIQFAIAKVMMNTRDDHCKVEALHSMICADSLRAGHNLFDKPPLTQVQFHDVLKRMDAENRLMFHDSIVYFL